MSQIPPDLTHMPSHIKQMIVNSSDTRTKIRQRKLSHDFKCEVDRAQIAYLELSMLICPRKMQLFWKKRERKTIKVTFEPSRCGYIMKNDAEDYEKRVTRGNYRKAAVEKLLSVFKHSKVNVGTLRIERSQFWPPHQDISVVFKEFNRILSEKSFRLHVEKLLFEFQASQEQILSILPYLEPITLKVFEVHRPPRPGIILETIHIDEVVQTEQWMGLEKVRISYITIEMPPEKMFHLKDVGIPLPAPPTETIVRFLEAFLLNPKLEYVALDWDGDLDTTRAKEYLRQFEKIPERCSSRCDCIRLPYEGNNIVYIAIFEESVEIQRDPFPNFDHWPIPRNIN